MSADTLQPTRGLFQKFEALWLVVLAISLLGLLAFYDVEALERADET